MERKHNRHLVPLAKHLRKEMTKEERHLWYDFLRNHPARFSRQKVLGHYIVDFYCPEAKLVIELDGSQHTEPEAIAYDRARTAFLQEKGYYVLRIANSDIWRNFTGVCQAVDDCVRSRI